MTLSLVECGGKGAEQEIVGAGAEDLMGIAQEALGEGAVELGLYIGGGAVGVVLGLALEGQGLTLKALPVGAFLIVGDCIPEALTPSGEGVGLGGCFDGFLIQVLGIKGLEVFEKDAPRHTIGGQVMNDEEQMLISGVLVGLEENQLEDGAVFQIEGCLKLGGAGLVIGGVEVLEGHGLLLGGNLEMVGVLKFDTQAQHVVVLDETCQRCFKRFWIEEGV